MITSPGLTSYDHWSAYNDDYADVVKDTPYRNPSTRIGYIQAEFSRDYFASQAESSDPEAILLAKEHREYIQMLLDEIYEYKRGKDLLDDEKLSEEHFEADDNSDDTTDNDIASQPHDETHQIEETIIVRDELNELKNRLAVCKERTTDGTRQRPAVKRDIERREIQKAA